MEGRKEGGKKLFPTDDQANAGGPRPAHGGLRDPVIALPVLVTVVGAAAALAAAVPPATVSVAMPALGVALANRSMQVAIATPDTIPILQSGGDTALAVAPSDTPAVARPGSVASSERGKIYSGQAGQIAVRIPRIDAKIPMDGTLDAPVWQQAAVLTGFSEYTPVDGVPAQDSTEVLVWYSPTALYFGVRAFEPHGGVHYKLADRDKIDADDNVQIFLTPFIHSRQALVFGVNPLGIQEDGTITEGVQVRKGFSTGATQTGRPTTDLSPDYVYESKGHVTRDGYEVVIRIPFRSIKYQSVDPQDWGINILRKVQHSGHEQTWIPTKLAAASFLTQSGALTGLTGLERGLVLDLNPFVTENIIGVPPAAPGAAWQYATARPAFGLNMRWGITNNLTMTGTYRPDFAEVESDATKLQLDPRNAVSYPEKRPFFLEGYEQFTVPNALIYTRNVEAPLAAAKLTGKVGDVTVAYLGALDDEDSSATGSGHALFNIVRAWQDVGEGSQVGILATDKEQGSAFNRVAGIDSRFVFAKLYSLTAQLATSSTRDSGTSQTTAGPMWYARFVRAGRTFGLDYLIKYLDPQFSTATGFISRTGISSVSLDQRLTFYNPPGSLIETYGGDFRLSNTWAGRTLIAFEAPEDRRYAFNTTATLHGGWQVGFAIYVESYGYDPTLYTYYYLGKISGSDTTYTKFPDQTFISNTDYVVNIFTPQFAHFSASFIDVFGRDENYYEWSSADVQLPQIAVTWQPTNQVRVNTTFLGQIYWRHSDGTLVASNLIPRLQFEYQLTRTIFIRLIGQYTLAYQDSLRDVTRSELPIYTYSPTTGLYTRAAASTTNQLQSSVLFAYQPVPGTVAFIGYGNVAQNPTIIPPFALTRQQDNIFIKFSYLFSVQ
jgi:hypothetical protein